MVNQDTDINNKDSLMTQGLMQGKRGLIMGVANDHSIAWGIAQALAAAGAELAFSYQGDILLKRVTPLAASVNSNFLIPCDVSDDAQIDQAFQQVQDRWGDLDFVVHAIAFSDKNELRGKYYSTSRQNFKVALDISCYSFTAVCQRAQACMRKNGSLLTLTYYGSEKVVPHYNVMGVAKAALEASVRYLAEDLGERSIRVNALSAGPIKTLAASGVGDFSYLTKWHQYNAPLRRNTTLEDVGKSALYLLSDLSSGVTGENLHVDTGYHIIGMKNVHAPDITLQGKTQQ